MMSKVNDASINYFMLRSMSGVIISNLIQIVIKFQFHLSETHGCSPSNDASTPISSLLDDWRDHTSSGKMSLIIIVRFSVLSIYELIIC